MSQERGQVLIDPALLLVRLGKELLTGELFETQLLRIVEQVGTTFEASFVICRLGSTNLGSEIRWDSTLEPEGIRSVDLRSLFDTPVTIEPTARQLALEALSLHAVVVGVGAAPDNELHLIVGRRQPFASAEVDCLRALATLLSLGGSRSAIQNAAIIDAGTGLYNRGFLDEALGREIERAKRFRVAMTLLILDVDHFKEINDRLGHLVGDRVLADIAHCLREGARSSDTIFRYGGDEFVVILPATPLTGARCVADRILTSVRSLTVRSGRREFRLGLSGGAAAVHARTTTQSLLRAADANLYAAKRAGRDQIVFPQGRAAELTPQLSLLSSDKTVLPPRITIRTFRRGEPVPSSRRK